MQQLHVGNNEQTQGDCMRAKLIVIEGGLRPGETLDMKLLNRPEDFPEVIFQRVLKQYARQLSFHQTVSILRARARDGCRREEGARA